MANAILDLTNGDMSAVADLSHAEIAAAADVPVKAASRLHKDAYWLARDHLETEKLKARGIERNETEYERNLRIANDALMSAAISHGNGRETPYSNRQLHLVGEADKREQYLKRVQYEPCPERFEQAARDRFDGRGYLLDKPAWIGGSSTQPNGGTCYQESTHETAPGSGLISGPRIAPGSGLISGPRIAPRVRAYPTGPTNLTLYKIHRLPRVVYSSAQRITRG